MMPFVAIVNQLRLHPFSGSQMLLLQTALVAGCVDHTRGLHVYISIHIGVIASNFLYIVMLCKSVEHGH